MIHDAPRTPRERRREDQLRRILDAAMKMVEEGGVDALGINKLAEVVDYTPGALYRYFGSKDALLSKLVERVLLDVRGYLDRGLALLPPRSRPLTRAAVIAASYRAFARREPQRFGLLSVTMADPRILLAQPSDAEPLVPLMLSSIQLLAGALAEAAEAEQLEPGDPLERALTVLALLQGASQMEKQARRAPGVVDVERLSRAGTRALFVGFGGAPRSVDAALEKVDALGDLAARLGGAS